MIEIVDRSLHMAFAACERMNRIDGGDAGALTDLIDAGRCEHGRYAWMTTRRQADAVPSERSRMRQFDSHDHAAIAGGCDAQRAGMSAHDFLRQRQTQAAGTLRTLRREERLSE